MEIGSADDLPPTARHVALTLAIYMNERGDSAFPGGSRLKRDTGLSFGAVRTALKALVGAEWLVEKAHGVLRRRSPTRVRLRRRYPTDQCSRFTGRTGAGGSPVHHDTGEGDSPVHLTTMTGAPGAPHLFNKSPIVRANPIDDDFDEMWEAVRASRPGQPSAPTGPGGREGQSADDLRVATENYAKSVAGSDPKFMLHGKTFFGPDERWKDYLDPLSTGNEAEEETTTTWIPNWEEEAREGSGPGGGDPPRPRRRTSLIGAMLVSNEAIRVGLETAHPGDFYGPANAAAFDAIRSLHRRGEHADALTTANEMRRHGSPQYADPLRLLQTAMNSVGIVGVAQYAEIVVKHARARRLQGLCRETSESVANFADPYDTTESLKSALASIDLPVVGGQQQAQTLDEIIDTAEDMSSWVIPGLLRVDWRAVVVGFEGHGKSTLLRQIAAMAAQVFIRCGTSIEPIRALIIDLENPPAVIAETGKSLVAQLRRTVGDAYDPEGCACSASQAASTCEPVMTGPSSRGSSHCTIRTWSRWAPHTR